MKTSIIIPTYNGANKILNALKSLEKLTRKPDEVIVVVDGSTDGTAEIIRSSDLSLLGFRMIEQANSGRATVRNRGATEAKGDLLVFMDDDIIVPEKWLSAHLEHHISKKNSLLVGKLESPKTELAGEFILFENWQNKKWNKDLTHTSEEEVLLKTPYISANNFSISKDLFFKLGQFDYRLNDAEDYDLAVRAFQENYPIYISSKAYAYHFDFGLKNFKSYIKRIRQYREAQEKLINFKPELYGDKAQNERFPVNPSGIKSKVFKLFANKYWIKAAEQGYLKWLPRDIRCRIYDIVVTANGRFFPEKVAL
ncbi:glycosyltransferase family 2 protein [Adhaeribacter radiodurans]|uniref:Glycosyltransferase family 2 protein n=1 Tax=Adhaeribacter radiodurans TaxID=2745197 RepID=A0A7L7L436_9BACT|nr:glycosyltransferase family A protein [Adhaeribacter radiodurans]QMU27567.1 glycosyltransferase family 2 protein [Adhaeribacter radiodurans]